MKKRSIIAFILLILLTTITSKQKIIISKFNIKEIKIENNLLLQSEDIIKSLLEIKWWDWDDNTIIKMGPYIESRDISLFIDKCRENGL